MATQTQHNGATSPETMEAIITSGVLKGETVKVTLSSDSALRLSERDLTPEEMQALQMLDEVSKRAEATAIRVGKTAVSIAEEMRRSTAELRGETA